MVAEFRGLEEVSTRANNGVKHHGLRARLFGTRADWKQDQGETGLEVSEHVLLTNAWSQRWCIRGAKSPGSLKKCRKKRGDGQSPCTKEGSRLEVVEEQSEEDSRNGDASEEQERPPPPPAGAPIAEREQLQLSPGLPAGETEKLVFGTLDDVP